MSYEKNLILENYCLTLRELDLFLGRINQCVREVSSIVLINI